MKEIFEDMDKLYNDFIMECDMFINKQKQKQKQQSMDEIEKEIIEDERKQDFISRTIK